MPTACTSTTAESTRRTLASMRTVFRCVASRNREKETLAKKKTTFECRAAPAPGDRTYGSGMLWSVGDYGFSWSSFASVDDACRLNFYGGGVYPQNNGCRAYGFQLRCLQE